MKDDNNAIVAELGLLIVFVLIFIMTWPDHKSFETPTGAYNRAVMQRTLDKTICVQSYTSTIRPSYAWSSNFKYALARESRVSVHDFELDHFVPLELGGAPKSPRNLWLEPWNKADRSDPEENRLRRAVCDGSMTLRAAQHEIIDFKRSHG